MMLNNGPDTYDALTNMPVKWFVLMRMPTYYIVCFIYYRDRNRTKINKINFEVVPRDPGLPVKYYGKVDGFYIPLVDPDNGSKYDDLIPTAVSKEELPKLDYIPITPYSVKVNSTLFSTSPGSTITYSQNWSNPFQEKLDQSIALYGDQRYSRFGVTGYSTNDNYTATTKQYNMVQVKTPFGYEQKRIPVAAKAADIGGSQYTPTFGDLRTTADRELGLMQMQDAYMAQICSQLSTPDIKIDMPGFTIPVYDHSYDITPYPGQTIHIDLSHAFDVHLTPINPVAPIEVYTPWTGTMWF